MISNQLFIMFSVIGGAALLPVLARWLRIPSAAAEIIYGVILFNYFHEQQPDWFLLLRETGLIYLMFIMGMEADIGRFLREKNFPWYIVIPLLSFVITPFVFVKAGYPFFLGLSAAMISATIIIPVLRESGITDTDLGRNITGTGLTGELLSILVLMGTDIYHRYGLTLKAGFAGAKLVLLFGAASAFLKFIYLVAWWNPSKVERIMESEDPVEEGIRMIIFIAFTGAAIAYTTGIEPILGSFLAGLVFNYVFKSKGRFAEKINAVGFGFFTPFFFIGVGADLDISLLESFRTIVLAALLSMVVFASNIYPLVFSRFMNMDYREGLSMSLLLSAPLSMMVIAGSLGIKMNMISEGMRSALVLAALIASIVYPSFFRLIAKKTEAEKAPSAETAGKV